MKREKNGQKVTNVTNGVFFGKSVLAQGCGRGVTNERKKTPSVTHLELGVEEVPVLSARQVDFSIKPSN